jgi:hypothetical protein
LALNVAAPVSGDVPVLAWVVDVVAWVVDVEVEDVVDVNKEQPVTSSARQSAATSARTSNACLFDFTVDRYLLFAFPDV